MSLASSMTKTPTPIALYAQHMQEIKHRLEVIDFFLQMNGNALYVQSTVESVCLQFRKVLELIAFASMIANKKAYSSVYDDFSKHHKADLLLKDLRRVNPNFYPIPIQTKSKIVDGIHSSELVVEAYLTQDDFVYVFKKCSALLHVPNPFGGRVGLPFYQKSFPDWRIKIMRLLNSHQVHFVDDDNMWVINMQEEGDSYVHYYTFTPQ